MAMMAGAGLLRRASVPGVHRPLLAVGGMDKRWVETVSGIDTPAKNKVLPWEQRVMPTTKTFYGEETIHNTFTSGSVEVGPLAPVFAKAVVRAAGGLGMLRTRPPPSCDTSVMACRGRGFAQTRQPPLPPPLLPAPPIPSYCVDAAVPNASGHGAYVACAGGEEAVAAARARCVEVDPAGAFAASARIAGFLYIQSPKPRVPLPPPFPADERGLRAGRHASGSQRNDTQRVRVRAARASPRVVRPQPSSALTLRVRATCRHSKSAHITDAKTMDVMAFKGRQHLEEVKQQYKVRAQLSYLFEPPDHSRYAATHGAQKESTASAFLQKFYAGTA